MKTQKTTPFALSSMAATFCLCCTLSPSAQALEWVLQPSVSATQTYNDNYRLSGTNELSTWATKVSPALDLSVKAPDWILSSKARLESRRIYEESDLNTDDVFLDINGMRQWQRSSLNLGLGYNQTTTLRNDFDDADAGLTILPIDRDAANASLNWTTTLTPTMSWSLGYQRQDVNYDQGDLGGESLTDYIYEVPSTSLTYQYSQKTRLTTNLSYAQYQPDTALDQDSDTTSLTFGSQYQFSSNLSFAFSVGARNTKGTQFTTILVPIPGTPFAFPQLVSQDSDETGFIYSGSLENTTETGAYSVSLNQSTMPTSTGTESETTSLTGDWKHHLSDAYSLQFRGLVSRYNTVGGNNSVNDRELYKLEPRLVWHGGRDWTLSGSYIYTRVKRDALDRVDTSNAVLATFRYQWTRQSLSR